MRIIQTLAQIQFALPTDGVGKSGNAFKTLVGRRDDVIDVSESERNRSEAGHRIDENARLGMKISHELGNGLNLVDDAGARLAVNDGNKTEKVIVVTCQF